jgi:hypothetical protein
MDTTIWIHRALASDILVRFKTREEAWLFCKELFNRISTSDDYYEVNLTWDCESFPNRGSCFDFCATSSLQVSIHDGLFHHVGWAGVDQPWTTTGTVLVSPEEAIKLGETGEPDGFIPGESESGIWEKNTKSLDELDEELDRYQQVREDIDIVQNLVQRARVHRTISATSLDGIGMLNG